MTHGPSQELRHPGNHSSLTRGHSKDKNTPTTYCLFPPDVFSDKNVEPDSVVRHDWSQSVSPGPPTGTSPTFLVLTLLSPSTQTPSPVPCVLPSLPTRASQVLVVAPRLVSHGPFVLLKRTLHYLRGKETNEWEWKDLPRLDEKF